MKKRIVTNSDLDAITSSVLLRQVEPVGDIKFIDLDEIRRGWKASASDICVNIPYVEGTGLWFDHHDSNKINTPFSGRHERAPSAARVVHNHYSALGRADVFKRFDELLRETDKVDSAAFEREDILNPRRYVLISHLIESHPARAGTVEENLLLIKLFEEGDAEHALANPVFKARAGRFLQNLEESKHALLKNIRRDGSVLILDRRSLDKRTFELCGNKFLPYVLFDNANVLVRTKHLDEARTLINVGFNIFAPDEMLTTHIGHFLKRFGGGGHEKAGGCSVPREHADTALLEIVAAMKYRKS